MTTSAVAGFHDFVSFVHKVFPSRQFYHRSNGVVHYTELGPWTQLAMTMLSLIFLGWVAYSSVNVVFKDQIISAKDARYRSMQQTYEGRISKMQLAYDELNGLLTLAEERFRLTTDDLEEKQKQLTSLLAQREAIDHARQQLLGRVQTLAGHENMLPDLPAKLIREIEAAESTEEDAVTAGAGEHVGGALLDSPRAGEHTLPALADVDDPLERHAQFNHTAQQFLELRDRLTTLSERNLSLMEDLSQTTVGEIAELERILKVAGLDAENIAPPQKTAEAAPIRTASLGEGGPLLGLFGTQSSDVSAEDPVFDQVYGTLTARLDRVSTLQNVLDAMPIALPGNSERMTSRFGPRRDPFTKRWAFHSGLDFAGTYGDPIFATAPGVVIRAERRGPYGNMVEIDHGAGFRTRFGHMSAIKVAVGDQVAFRQLIGLVGSTGRSTGPHLHYEVWYEGKVRDPKNFLRAGRYVLEK